MYQTGNEVGSIADAYRSNPQALAQRYSQNKELIDLLALQKLKSEKDAAARQMQMAMETSPGTIRDQREAELMGRTKEEVLQATGGAIQNQQRQQQQAMQNTANSGIAAASPRMGFKRGGVVGYEEGGEVEGRKAKIQKALEMGATVGELESLFRNNPDDLRLLAEIAPPATNGGDVAYGDEWMDEDQNREIRVGSTPTVATSTAAQAPPADKKPMTGLEAFLQTISLPRRAAMGVGKGLETLWNAAGDYGPTVGEAAEYAADPSEDTRLRGMFERNPNRSRSDAPPLANTDAVAELFPEEQLQEVVPQGKRVDPAPAPAPEQSPLRSNVEAALNAALTADLNAEAEAGRQAARDAGVGMTEADQAAFNKRRDQLEALQAEINNPDTRRDDQLKSYLLGMAGRRGFGNTVAGGASSSIATRENQNERRGQGIAELLNLENSNRNTRRSAGQNVLAAGEARRADTMAASRQAMASGTSLLNNDLRQAVAKITSGRAGNVPDVVLDASKRVQEALEGIQTALEENADYRMARSKGDEAAMQAIEDRISREYSDTLLPAKALLRQYGFGGDEGGTASGMPEGFRNVTK